MGLLPDLEECGAWCGAVDWEGESLRRGDHEYWECALWLDQMNYLRRARWSELHSTFGRNNA